MTFLKVYIPRFGVKGGCVLERIEGPDAPTKAWLNSVPACNGATYVEVLSGADGLPVMTYLVAPEILTRTELECRMENGVAVQSVELDSGGLWYLWAIGNGGAYSFISPCGSVFVMQAQGLIYKAVRLQSSPAFAVLQ